MVQIKNDLHNDTMMLFLHCLLFILENIFLTGQINSFLFYLLFTAGVLYGQGVYFAGDASYSSQSYLTGHKPGMKRYMFLVKVLTGEFVKGNPSMRVLPPIKASEKTVLYDSAVDDVNNPMEFVIFHDTQAYPEYLITYTL